VEERSQEGIVRDGGNEVEAYFKRQVIL